MANWNETINIAGLHRMYTSGGISIQQVAHALVRKLKNTEAFHHADPELIDIMCGFEAIDEIAELKDYNSMLEALYQYGDRNNQLWIEAEGVDPQDSADVGPKTRALFSNEDTQPQKMHYHGAHREPSLYKGPYLGNNPEWVQYNFGPEPKTDNKLEEWEKEKLYKVGDTVKKGSMKYRARFSCSGVDPTTNSYNKPTDSWDYLGMVDKTPTDPERVYQDRLTCSLPAKARDYGLTRKYHYMSEEDFNKKLVDFQIDPATMPKDLYKYMKDCEETYQEWLIDRWHKQNLTFRAAVPANNN